MKNITAGFFKFQALSDFDKSRENNFTLLRIFFALAVLFGHSFPISGHGSDPISMAISPFPWIGAIAVDGFFAISGFLVTASFVQRGAFAFVSSRALRLYPGLIAYTTIAVFLIGPLCSTVPLKTYFEARPWFLYYNVPLWRWIMNLPYVFVGNPLGSGTNGSGWTLPVELRCYIMIFVFGFFGIFDKKARANIAILSMLVLSRFAFPQIPLFGAETNNLDPLTFFLLGSLFWINRHMVYLNWSCALLALILPMFLIKHAMFGNVFPIATIYIIFVLIYKTPFIDIDKFGDMSYGIYIYAWPVQQMVWSPGQSAYINALYACAIVVPLSFASWHLVEKPALNLRKFLPSAKKTVVLTTVSL